jgi:prophage regulatory protein
MLAKWPHAWGLGALQISFDGWLLMWNLNFEPVAWDWLLQRGARLAELEVSMNARFLTKSDVVERTQIKSENDKAISSELDEVIFLRLPMVRAVTGLSKSSLYELIRANSFPAPVHLGARTVAWVASEVKQWAAERILSSRTPSPSVGGRRLPQRALPRQWATSKKWA